MNKSAIGVAMLHAKECAPRECCGLLIGSGRKQHYVPCNNIATGTEHFVIDPEDYALAEDAGKILAIVHSHPGGTCEPSPADLAGCDNSNLPWVIIADEEVNVITPSGYEAPYVGRIYVHGIMDCYSIVRDWYGRERNIQLENFNRRDKWWQSGSDLYAQNFASQGFVEIADKLNPEVGDAYLMRLDSQVVNHAAIYVGEGMILHHPYERLSGRTIYGDFWQKATTHLLRHKSCVK